MEPKLLMEMAQRVLTGLLLAALIGIYVQFQSATRELVMIRGDVALIKQAQELSADRLKAAAIDNRAAILELETRVRDLEKAR